MTWREGREVVTQTDKNAAYVAAVLLVIVFSVPASRDYVTDVGEFVGAMVYFGLLVMWNWFMSMIGMIG